MSAEPEFLPADALAEEEPKYLRRQKPVGIRKRKFGGKTWPLYRRILVVATAVLAGGLVVYGAGHFLLYSPSVMLERPDQLQIEGNRFVTREAVVEKFAADMGHSVIFVPLQERRAALEALPWVEQARVLRVLPGLIRVEITERTPLAFLRVGDELSLVDANGVILERPVEANFHFPVVSGIRRSIPLGVRARRMKVFAQFMKEIESSSPGADDHVSEVDLSDAADMRATLTGLGIAADAASAVLVHFGDSDFSSRYHLLADNIDQWRASAGRVDSVDLRFAKQVVVNPGGNAMTGAIPQGAVRRPVAAQKPR
jgi:cell division protein FtsQ